MSVRHVTIGEIARASSGKTPARDVARYWDGEIPWISPKDMKVDYLSTSQEKITQAAIDDRHAEILPAGTVLVVVRGMILAHTLPVGITMVPAAINQDIKGLSVSSRVDADYLHWMIAASSESLLQSTMVAGHGTKRLATENLLSTKIPLPALDEQRRVVARIREALERVEEIERLHVMQREDAARLLPSALTEVFAHASSSHSAVSLGSVITDCRYGTNTKCHAAKDSVTVLRIPNVSGGALDLSDLKYCARDAIDDRTLLEDGDLLIIRTNGSPSLVGRCAVFRDATPKERRDAVSFASYLIRLRFDPRRCLPEYVRYFLASSMGRSAINRIRRSSAGQSNINSANIKAIRLPLPDLGAQRAMVKALADIERTSRSLASESRDHGDAGLLRAAILRQAFSGAL